jgi:hypothetical protein
LKRGTPDHCSAAGRWRGNLVCGYGAPEWRDTPVRHRYVHGGFRGTDTRFSFYFPPKEQYQGRFFQHITPAPDSENLAQLMPAGEYNKIGSSIAGGAYFVETNGGGQIDMTKGSLALTVGACRSISVPGSTKISACGTATMHCMETSLQSRRRAAWSPTSPCYSRR